MDGRTLKQASRSQRAIPFCDSSRMLEGRCVMNDRIAQLSRNGFKIEASCGKTPLVSAMAAISSIITLGGLVRGICPSSPSLHRLFVSERTR